MEPLITQALTTLMDLTGVGYPADVRLGAAQSLLTFAFDAQLEQDAPDYGYPEEDETPEEEERETVTLSPEEAAARAQILAEQAQADAPVRVAPRSEGSGIGSRNP